MFLNVIRLGAKSFYGLQITVFSIFYINIPLIFYVFNSLKSYFNISPSKFLIILLLYLYIKCLCICKRYICNILISLIIHYICSESKFMSNSNKMKLFLVLLIHYLTAVIILLIFVNSNLTLRATCTNAFKYILND